MTRLFEPHIHMYSRTTDDYDAMSIAGIEVIVQPSFWLGTPRTSVATFEDYWEHMITFETKRAREYGIEQFVCISVNPKEATERPPAWTGCSTAKDAAAIVRQVNSDSLGMLLDTFHMNIEEDSFEDAIQTAGRLLEHTHFADNNRKMPGSAHIDFVAIMRCLQEIGYNGYVSFEPNIADRNYKRATKAGLDFVKSKVTLSH